MKVLVVSGFLGAGKTTFIRELARRIEGSVVVLENEFGEVGVDGDLLADVPIIGNLTAFGTAQAAA